MVSHSPCLWVVAALIPFAAANFPFPSQDFIGSPYVNPAPFQDKYQSAMSAPRPYKGIPHIYDHGTSYRTGISPNSMTKQGCLGPGNAALYGHASWFQPFPKYGSDGRSPNPDDIAVPEGPVDNPMLDRVTVNELCALPPEKGDGDEDTIRFYYNPVVQQCLPFSYTGTGGNANRFVSIKNCYEICHPSETPLFSPRCRQTGVRAYIAGPQSSNCSDGGIARDMIVRKIPNPVDPSKTLTVVQKAQYVYGPKSGVAVIEDGTGTTRIVPTKKPQVKIVQRLIRYKDGCGQRGGGGGQRQLNRDGEVPSDQQNIGYGQWPYRRMPSFGQDSLDKYGPFENYDLGQAEAVQPLTPAPRFPTDGNGGIPF